jgi:hypothetical protein
VLIRLQQTRKAIPTPPQTNYRYTMSAPNAGRQSPEPEQTTNAQTGKTAGGQADAGPTDGNAQTKSDDQKSGLSSNPDSVMDKAAEAKTSKSTGDPNPSV